MKDFEISYYDNGELKRTTIKADSGGEARKKFEYSDDGLCEILSIVSLGDES